MSCTWRTEIVHCARAQSSQAASELNRARPKATTTLAKCERDTPGQAKQLLFALYLLHHQLIYLWIADCRGCSAGLLLATIAFRPKERERESVRSRIVRERAYGARRRTQSAHMRLLTPPAFLNICAPPINYSARVESTKMSETAIELCCQLSKTHCFIQPSQRSISK